MKKPDIKIDGQGFFRITSRTTAGDKWCRDRVVGYSPDQCYTNDQNYAQDIAEGATGDGLRVAVNGFLYLPGGLRGRAVAA